MDDSHVHTHTSQVVPRAQWFAVILEELVLRRRSQSGKPLTLTTVSNATGIPRSYLDHVRHERIANPGIERVAALAQFFGFTPGELTEMLTFDLSRLEAVTDRDVTRVLRRKAIHLLNDLEARRRNSQLAPAEDGRTIDEGRTIRLKWRVPVRAVTKDAHSQ